MKVNASLKSDIRLYVEVAVKTGFYTAIDVSSTKRKDMEKGKKQLPNITKEYTDKIIEVFEKGEYV